MPSTKRETLAGWGNSPSAECESFRPEKQRELSRILCDANGPLLARGLGRSYGDASLQPQGVIRTERLDHIIAFDTQSGTIRAQAGVTLAELMDLLIPQGYMPPVLPGTRHVTLGGAFACNVHGKNQWRDGDFAEHVASIRLLLADGRLVECSPEEHSDLFWATAGGMGMTGVIEDLTLRLKPIASASLRTTTSRVSNIADMIAAFEHYRDYADYMVGWIDHMATGDALGQGIFEAASHIPTQEGGAPLTDFVPLETKINVPVFMPAALLNRHSMALYNRWRFKRYSSERTKETVGFNGFFHPLDAIGHWNKLYGKRGFFQYQCLIPETPDIAAQLQAFLAAIQSRNCFSFLAVVKYHRDGKGPLAFSKKGYSIALDFPNTSRVRSLIPHLNRWVAEREGRVYLAKDALLTQDLFEQMYHPAEWQTLIHQADPGSRFTSLMSKRLAWKAE